MVSDGYSHNHQYSSDSIYSRCGSMATFPEKEKVGKNRSGGGNGLITAPKYIGGVMEKYPPEIKQ